ncbi:MAG: DNA mismatch repair endonuclease MutL [Chloroflexi bacterium]|nr:DNA mismatch repair endonuclease MutL [Chloroflexota bacterium]
MTAEAARPRIEVLAPEVAARIAAGEVIERPASVVKELIENALDAGAGRVEVEVDGGGVDRIRVRDDGCGIPPDQVADAFERHATSKLRSEHDLYVVRTLGFRGEALAALAAAADVDFTTRPPADDAASVVRVRDGRVQRQGAAGSGVGTTVEARDLFAALPARRRFLRSPRAEARAVAQVVTDYALAYPEVAFRLTSDSRTVLQSPGSGDPRDAVAAVHGAATSDALRPRHADLRDDEAVVEVAVLAGAPALHRASRDYLHLVANGRAIVSRSLAHAVEQAYEGLIPAGRHPVALVRITVPPDQVDVNVHPTKAEVRFRHDRAVYAAVMAAVRDAIGAAPVASLRLPSSSGAEQREVTPWPSSVSTPPTGHDVVAGARPASAVPAEAAPGALDDVDGNQTLHGQLPLLRPMGQVELTYIVAEAPDGVYLVDQHAAHERVLYEQVLARRRAGESASQPLLEAVVAALTPSQAALAAVERDLIEAVGWVLDETDGAALIVRALPADLRPRDRADPARALGEYLDRMDADERLTGPDRIAATLACRGAVMAGDRLEAEQQRALLRALEACEMPHTCPHGRPTMLHLSRASLDRSFGRS